MLCVCLLTWLRIGSGAVRLLVAEDAVRAWGGNMRLVAAENMRRSCVEL